MHKKRLTRGGYIVKQSLQALPLAAQAAEVGYAEGFC
jgi:hypothetical protein